MQPGFERENANERRRRVKINPRNDFVLIEVLEVQCVAKSGLTLVRDGTVKRDGRDTPVMVFGKVLRAGPNSGLDEDVIVAFPPGAEVIVYEGEDTRCLVKATAIYATVEGYEPQE